MSEQDPSSQEPAEEISQEASSEESSAAGIEETQQVEEPETRDEEMERLRGEVVMAEKRVLQAQAEAENFRKRMRRDFEDQIRFASLPLVEDILLVRDNLLRGLEAADHATDSAGLKEGVAMVAKQLDDTLTKHSVEEISTEDGAFDPNLHEAISQMPSEDHESGSIMHVAQTGFRMHDRVIRPTQVVVSSGPANQES
ncbi:MAG: nucleotide exchange factor GrpE [Planctomycetota bacterium]|nr:nucleotide exchange factor GrpE [Planctomycetota bacterium]